MYVSLQRVAHEQMWCAPLYVSWLLQSVAAMRVIHCASWYRSYEAHPLRDVGVMVTAGLGTKLLAPIGIENGRMDRRASTEGKTIKVYHYNLPPSTSLVP